MEYHQIRAVLYWWPIDAEVGFTVGISGRLGFLSIRRGCSVYAIGGCKVGNSSSVLCRLSGGVSFQIGILIFGVTILRPICRSPSSSRLGRGLGVPCGGVWRGRRGGPPQ